MKPSQPEASGLGRKFPVNGNAWGSSAALRNAFSAHVVGLRAPPPVPTSRAVSHVAVCKERQQLLGLGRLGLPGDQAPKIRITISHVYFGIQSYLGFFGKTNTDLEYIWELWDGSGKEAGGSCFCPSAACQAPTRGGKGGNGRIQIQGKMDPKISVSPNIAEYEYGSCIGIWVQFGNLEISQLHHTYGATIVNGKISQDIFSGQGRRGTSFDVCYDNLYPKHLPSFTKIDPSGRHDSLGTQIGCPHPALSPVAGKRPVASVGHRR